MSPTLTQTVRLDDGAHELNTRDALSASVGLLREFHPALTIEQLENLQNQGLRLFGLVASQRLVCVATVMYQLNLSEGKRAWIEDLLTPPTERSKGHGGCLLQYVVDTLHGEGIRTVMLQVKEENTAAQRFYEAHRNSARGIVYKWRPRESMP